MLDCKKYLVVIVHIMMISSCVIVIKVLQMSIMSGIKKFTKKKKI